jgi:hypothetical protein
VVRIKGSQAGNIAQLTDDGGLGCLLDLVHADEVLHDLREALLVLVHEVVRPAMGK